MSLNVIALVAAGVALVAAVLVFLRLRGKGAELAAVRAELTAARADLQRYAPITSIEAHVASMQGELAKATAARDEFLTADQRRRAELNANYNGAFATFERLRAEVASLEENLEDMSYGLYKPHYTFETAEGYKLELDRVYDKKKAMIRAGTAASFPCDWTVNGSLAEGKRMTKQNVKVMLRAFNGEVDAAVAKVTWNNVGRMEERIRKSFQAINANGTVNRISISQAYLDLALAELWLTHEFEVKKYEEREEQRAIREQRRDEERALREAERAQQEAATEEARFEKALEKARAEVEKATGDKLSRANEKMIELERKLAEAHEKMQRAKSLAEQTRSGYVYVISNVGTLGDKTFKIGMTRRLDPMDRVQELGDASVPFPFDVHAMIHSEDAPTLENALHREFASRRVNLVNLRKEYFNVTLEEIEAVARTKNVAVQFTKLAEAREYRETLARRQQAANGSTSEAAAPQANVADPFPKQLLV